MSEVRIQLADGETRIYGIIGDPIKQVKSPLVFNEKFRASAKNAVMIPLHAKPETFDECLRGLKALANLDGIIVTLPYKSRVSSHVDKVLPAARRIGAINALRREPDGKWSGDMFDGKGFLAGMLASGVSPKGLSIMLIGAGGAGTAIADSLAEAGASAITVFDRDEAKSLMLVKRIAPSHSGCRIEAGTPTIVGKQAIINATPTGMAPGDGLPVETGPLHDKLFVADIVPRPDLTPLLALAQAYGCRTMGAQAMVAGQADEILRFFRLI